jgi:protein TonB
MGPAQRRFVVALIVGLHLLAVWGLLQVQAVREATTQAVPILVSLLAAPTPPVPPPPTASPAPKPQPRARLQPAPQPPVLATPASPTPETITVPPPQQAPEPVPAPPQPTTAIATTAPAAPPAPPPAPKLLPDDAVQYLQAPQLLYPPLSLRRRETGLVVVRAYVGTEGGAPRTVQVERSSGHARLDQAALSAVQQARFRPYAEKGQPVEGWALIPIRFELEK